jgi:Zn-finger nucleic acid-binding protein
MKCPVCKTTNLTMSERNGVEIDYCPDCRGVWLDRGELDKIIEKTNALTSPSPAPQQASHPAPNYNQYGHGHSDYKYKRKKSFLEEIFD